MYRNRGSLAKDSLVQRVAQTLREVSCAPRCRNDTLYLKVTHASQGVQPLSSTLCGLPAEDRDLSISNPGLLDTIRPPDVWSRPKGEGQCRDSKKTDVFYLFIFISSEEWWLRFRNQIFIENEVQIFITDLSFWIETHTPKVNMVTINKTKAMRGKERKANPDRLVREVSPRKCYLSGDLQNE